MIGMIDKWKSASHADGGIVSYGSGRQEVLRYGKSRMILAGVACLNYLQSIGIVVFQYFIQQHFAPCCSLNRNVANIQNTSVDIYQSKRITIERCTFVSST